jgi:hypothetical protein
VYSQQLQAALVSWFREYGVETFEGMYGKEQWHALCFFTGRPKKGHDIPPLRGWADAENISPEAGDTRHWKSA